jgi:hypothetical protein
MEKSLEIYPKFGAKFWLVKLATFWSTPKLKISIQILGKVLVGHLFRNQFETHVQSTLAKPPPLGTGTKVAA